MNRFQRFVSHFAALLLLSLIVSEPALAFRCGQKIVIENMHELQVKKACGEPTTARQVGVVLRGGYLSNRRTPAYGIRVERLTGNDYYTQEVALTEYIYNFGPRKFMRRLLFEGGVLVKIESIGYGYRENKSK